MVKLSKLDNASFWGHLEELRRRLLWMIAAWVIGVIIAFPLSQNFLDHISRTAGRLVFLSPSEAFTVRWHISLIFGFFLAIPVWVYHVLRFLWEGLKVNERRGVLGACALVLMLSYVGIVFADKVLIPISLKFLLNFANDVLQPMLSAKNFFSFYFCILLFCCLLFNIPFIIMGLAALHLLDAEILVRYRKHVCVGVFILAAFITPPDVITQLMMALPIYLLYELSILGVRIMIKRDSGVGIRDSFFSHRDTSPD